MKTVELLAKIEARLESIENYLKQLNGKIIDHENRIRELEKLKNQMEGAEVFGKINEFYKLRWQIAGIVSLIPLLLMLLKILKLL